MSRDYDYFPATPAGLHGYHLDGRLIWFTPCFFTEPAIANGRIYLLDETPGPNPRSPAVVCLAPDPGGRPLRNLALELVGQVQRGGRITLRVTNTGAVTQRGVQMVADISFETREGHGKGPAARRRFRIGTLKPGERRSVTFIDSGEKRPYGERYLSAFLAGVKDDYPADNQIAVSF